MGSLPGQPSSLLHAGVFCLLLALLFLVKLLHPGWRRRFGWGLVQGQPISLPGHLGLVAAFALMGAGLLRLYDDQYDDLGRLLPWLGVVLFFVTGIVDRVCAERRAKRPPRSRG